MKMFIPNFITCLNLFSGILAVIAAYNGQYQLVLLFVMLSALFDFLDGFAARALKAYSPMGKELDSLADMVSFGLLPGMVAFSLLDSSLDAIDASFRWVLYTAFLLTIFSALRLAKFNIDTRQSESFIGLATPANALFWVGLSIVEVPWLHSLPVLLALIVIFSYLLVAEIPMFSLKFKSLKWSDNKWRYIFLIGVLLLIIFLRLESLVFIILWYIILSFLLYIEQIFNK